MLTEHIWSVRAVALPFRWSCERGENEAWMTSHLQSQENLADSGDSWLRCPVPWYLPFPLPFHVAHCSDSESLYTFTFAYKTIYSCSHLNTCNIRVQAPLNNTAGIPLVTLPSVAFLAHQYFIKHLWS